MACAANQVGSRVSAVGGVGLLAYSPPLPIANTRTRGQLGMGGKWTPGKQQIIQRPTFPTTNGHGVQILSPYLVREESCAFGETIYNALSEINQLTRQLTFV